jgi:phospholipid-binding lipoprotein MlaA
MNKLILLVILVLLNGCTTLQPNDDISLQTSSDPMEGFNRSIYKFNESTDRAIIKPVAKGYRSVVPAPARTGIRNFFNNLNEPLYAVNNFYKVKQIERLVQFSVLW